MLTLSFAKKTLRKRVKDWRMFRNRLLNAWRFVSHMSMNAASFIFLQTIPVLLLHGGLQTLLVLLHLLQFLNFHIALYSSHLVEHVGGQISGVVWEDVGVLVGLGQMGEGYPLPEGMSMHLHVLLLDIITQHIG